MQEDQCVVLLIDQWFNIPTIANILCVSCQTVQRRLQEFGLSCREVYSTMSDGQLDTVINFFWRIFHKLGTKE